MKMYRVMVLTNGDYKAVPVTIEGTTEKIGSFQCQDWQIFERELRYRLKNEKPSPPTIRPRGV